jgi:hypothetical protein
MQVYTRLASQEQTALSHVFSHSQADEHVLDKAQKARNGQSFTALYRGDIGGFRSKVRLTLCWFSDSYIGAMMTCCTARGDSKETGSRIQSVC